MCMRDPVFESGLPLMRVPTAGSRHFGQLLSTHKGNTTLRVLPYHIWAREVAMGLLVQFSGF